MVKPDDEEELDDEKDGISGFSSSRTFLKLGIGGSPPEAMTLVVFY
jgi:hypothetical protein